MILTKHWVVILGFLLCSINGIAQLKKDSVAIDETNYKLEEVVVSATRTLRQLSSLPLQVQLISEKEIKKIHSSRLSDLLGEQTGVIMVPGHTRGEGVQLQGIDAKYTMILLDGVPLVGRTVGTLDLTRISVGDIKQVEIIKGASSSLYGSEALGGVINIITGKSKKGFYSDLDYRLSRFKTNDLSANFGYGGEKFRLDIFSNFYNSKGYTLRENRGATVPPFNNYTNRVKAHYQISDATNIQATVRYYQENQNYNILKNHKTSFLKEWNSHLKLNHRYNEKWSSFLELYATQYHTNEKSEEINTHQNLIENDFKERQVRAEIRGTYKPLKSTTYMGGLGWNYNEIYKTRFLGVPNMKSLYGYLQYEGYFLNKLNVIGGLRFDSNSEYASQLSPKIAVKYDFNKKISIKSSVGYGFKAPDFGDLYYNFTNPSVGYSVFGSKVVVPRIEELQKNGEIDEIYISLNDLGNQELKPESSISFNLGINYQPVNSLKLEANYFRNDIKNQIAVQTVAKKSNGRLVHSYYNVSKFYTHGWEVDATYKVNSRIRLSAGYQLLFAKDKDAKEDFKKGRVSVTNTKGESVRLGGINYFGEPNRSRHSANAKLYVSIPKWKTDINVRWIYRGKYPFFDTNGNKYYDTHDEFVSGYSLVNASLNKKIGRYYTIGLGANNLLNYKDVEHIPTISGRILYLNLNIKLSTI